MPMMGGRSSPPPIDLRELYFGKKPGMFAGRGMSKPDRYASEVIHDLLEGQLRKVTTDRRASKLADKLTGIVELVPGFTAGQSLRKGNYLAAGIDAAINSIPEVGPAAKAMFLGVAAKNANKVALKRAERLAAKGADRKEILDKTGWFKGRDDKWRFEIPDNNISLDAFKIDPARAAQRDVNKYMQKHYGVDDFTTLPIGSAKRNEANSLYAGFSANEAKKTQLFEDVAQHPELLDAYPSFRHIGVGPETRRNLGGSWAEDTGTLRVRPTAENANSITAHELQHAVQGEEGFARGGLPESFQKEIDEQIRALNVELGEVHSKLVAAGGRNSPTAAPFAEEYDRIQRDRQALVEQSPRDLYRRLAGEVEARNVETRLYLTPEQRMATPPWETEDVPWDEQIVRFRP